MFLRFCQISGSSSCKAVLIKRSVFDFITRQLCWFTWNSYVSEAYFRKTIFLFVSCVDTIFHQKNKKSIGRYQEKMRKMEKVTCKLICSRILIIPRLVNISKFLLHKPFCTNFILYSNLSSHIYCILHTRNLIGLKISSIACFQETGRFWGISASLNL